MKISWIVLLSMGLAFNTLGQQTWKRIRSVEELYSRHPEKVDSLLLSLDLDHKGLEKVRDAFKAQNSILACRELLEYYRYGNNARYLRREQPVASQRTDAAADSVLQDIITYQEVSGHVPRNANGQRDWTYHGPKHDIEWAWGFNRHGHVAMLMESYFDTGNVRYAEGVDDHIQDWVLSSVPYPGKKSATPMWRGLEVALRAKNWVRVFFGLLDSDMLSPATRILMLSSIPAHIHYMKNFHAKAGNWLTMEMSGLAMVTTAWPEFRAAAGSLAYAKDNMLDGLEDQVYPDGVQKELTSHYHQVALNNFTQFLTICGQAEESLPPAYRDALENMNNYLAYSVSPAGYGILNNDSDHRYNRDAILESADDFDREDWTFLASNGQRGQRPSGHPSVIFPWAGQLISRSGYDANAHYSFFDIGPWGTGHQHSDKLHISLSAFGRDLLVDGGRFAYRGELADKFRRYATGSASHNVVMIDNAGQDAGPTIATESLGTDHYKITDRFDYAWSSFDKFKGVAGAVNHSRALFYVRGKFWIVADRIQTDRPRKVETLWHWHPGNKVQAGANGIVYTENEKGNLAIIPLGTHDWKLRQVAGQDNPPQGWYSDSYNRAEPAPASIYTTEISKTSSFFWVLQPSDGKVEPLSVSLIAQDEHKATLRVADGSANQWEIVLPFNDSEVADYSFTPSYRKKAREGSLQQNTAVDVLLSRLNLDEPALRKVAELKDDPHAAAVALLEYYRSRRNVIHPIDRNQKANMHGNAAGEDDMKAANDAMRHVFVGQSAYPPYYCGDDIDWGLRPVADNEWVWQLNRMNFWDAMGKAYWHTGDEKYAQEWCLQLLDWTQKNPRDEAHAYAWRSIEAGIRGHRWTGLFQRFVDSPSFTPEVLVAFLNSCYDHAAYLMTRYRQRSNWGLMEAEGMGFIAITFPEFREAEKWRTEAIARLNREINDQVYPDGHQRELAIGYHTGSIEWFKRTLDLAVMNGLKDRFPQSYLDRIEKMCEVPLKLGLPDGSTAQFGDSWKGEPGRIWPMLAEWGRLFNRPDFLYVATQGRQGSVPSSTAFALETSGFYSMRDGWKKDAICLVLKCGPDGGGHCQPDNGTFELYAGGRHLMPDAGSYIYSSDPTGRAWFRQTKVHQTLTLNGENSAYSPRQLLWKPGERDDVLVVENESYPGLTHRRGVIFVDKKYFVIVDEAIGPATGNVALHFQLAPGKALLDSANFSARSDFEEGWNVLVQTDRQDGLKMEAEEGWVSFLYTKKEQRPAFCYRVEKKSAEAIRFLTVVVPYDGVKPPKIGARFHRGSKAGDNNVAVEISAGRKKRKVSYSLQ